MLYEIGDPQAYLLPDVVCDFTRVNSCSKAKTRAVHGAKGLPPTDQYKVSATYPDGFRCTASCLIAGIDAVDKAGGSARRSSTKPRNVQPARLGALQRGQHRTARQRSHLRPHASAATAARW
jgi:hypothetical protein